MSGLVQQVEAGSPNAPRPTVALTTERWVAIIVLASLGGLVLARHAFREFIPR